VPLSRMVAPYAAISRIAAGTRSTAILIPVTNPIESVFATVRHRTVRTKGALSPTTAKLMVFKLLCAASKTWRRLKGTNQLPKVIAGVRFENGIEVIQVSATHAAGSRRHLKSRIARIALSQAQSLAWQPRPPL